MKRMTLVHVGILLAVVSITVLGVPGIRLTAQAGKWLPDPTGPHQVGTTFYHWVDKAHDELFTVEAGDKREVVVRLYYPAEVKAGATPATYLPNGKPEARYFEEVWHDSDGVDVAQLGAELAQMPTHSYRDMPVSGVEARYPVLIYSPGAPGNPEFATAQLEQLASQGYIVAAIYHPYTAAWVPFPDGRVVFDAGKWRLGISRTLTGDFFDSVGAQDQIFVLDQLKALNGAPAGGPFSRRLDLDRVGTFGASWGAWQSAMAAFLDPRFKAALIEHPHARLPAKVTTNGLSVPIMFMDSQRDVSSAYSQMKGPAYRLALEDMSGWKLGDFGLWPGFLDRVPGPHGSVKPARAVEVVNAYALAFFDRYLKGKTSPLLAGPAADYPEVKISSRNT